MSSVDSAKSSIRDQPLKDNPQPVDEYDDEAERNYKPKSLKFWMIMFGVFISIFLVALVRSILHPSLAVLTD